MNAPFCQQRAHIQVVLLRISPLSYPRAAPERFNSLAASLKEDVTDVTEDLSLDLLLEILAFQRATSPPPDTPSVPAWRAEQLTEAASTLLAPQGPIDAAKVAQYFGVSHDTEGESADVTAEEKKMKKQRAALRVALLAKANALSDCIPESLLSPSTSASPSSSSPTSEPSVEQFNAAVNELKQWVEGGGVLEDEADKDTLATTLAKHELLRHRPGAALSTLRKRLKAQPQSTPAAKEVTKQLVELYRSLGLDFWAVNAEEALFAKFPVVKLPL